MSRMETERDPEAVASGSLSMVRGVPQLIALHEERSISVGIKILWL